MNRLNSRRGYSCTYIIIFKPHRSATCTAYFSVYYYTMCVLLKAGCATLEMKVCNIKILR